MPALAGLWWLLEQREEGRRRFPEGVLLALVAAVRWMGCWWWHPSSSVAMRFLTCTPQLVLVNAHRFFFF